MATTPLGGRLPNVNRKGSSPCVGGSSSSSGSATSQRKQQQQERTGRDHHHHHHHHHHRHHQSKSGQSHHHHHHHAQQTHRKDQKQPERTQIQQESNHQSSTVAAHAGELDPAATNATNNFEYDDNEWDIGIGDLIIDLDADIEKTRDEKLSAGTGMASTPASAAATTNHLNSASSSNSPSSSNGQFSSSSGSSNSGTCSQGNGSNSNSGANSSIASVGGASSKQQVAGVNSAAHPNQGNPGKMAVEHSATVDKGLKMKIKRTKPGTKSSEAKHEIVKSNELNGTVSAQDAANCSSNSSSNSASMSASSPGQGQMQNATQDSQTQSGQSKSKPTHQQTGNTATSGASVSTNTGSKRGSSGHRRDKARDKHDKQPQSNHQSQQSKPEINGSIRPIMQNHAGSATSQNPGSGQSIGSPPTTSTSSASSSCSSSTSSAPSGAYSNSASPGASSSSAIAAIAGSNAGQQQGPTPAATAPQQQQPPGPPPSSRTGGFSVSQGSSSNGAAAPCPPASPASATAAAGSASKPEQTKVATVPGAPTIGSMPDDSIDMAASPPPSKKMKISPKNEPKDMSDMCVGTSVGTITEPECLGPCEPGTSVTLEGIVWHETEGGVLVVNVTWRGKTYVGTLLDCTRHDWAPPRFCDSPTSDLDARTPKGRGKRGRAAANATPGNDLSNFTETRSSVHSKLRNGGAKGRRGAQGSPAASPSPAAFVPPRPDPAAKRKPRGPEEEEKSKRRAPPPTPPSGSPPASPVLLECPEPNCSKKYKHINGLKYHQSHAHGSADDEDTKEGITSMSENDESNIEAPSPATPVKSPPDVKTETCTPVRVASPPSTLPPETPPRVPSPGVEAPADKSIVKPGVLRFGQDAEQRSVQPSTPSAPAIVTPSPPSPGPRQSPRPVPSPHIPQPITIPQPPQPSQNLIMQQSPQMTVQSSAQSQPAVPVVHQMQPLPAHSQAQVHMQNQPLPPTPPTSQPIQTMSPLQSLANQMPPTPGLTGSSSSHLQSYPGVGLHTKIPQFKVKPTAALMPEQDKSKDPRATKPQGYKKKSRKSPGGSPHPPMETPMVDNTREDVQSPAYSDISDDGAPVLEAESADKSLKQGQDKDTKAPPPSHIPAHFGIYPYYGQPPPYLVPSVQQQSEKQPGDSSKPSDLATKPDPGKTLNVPQMPSMTSLQSLAAAAGEKDKKELSSPQAQAQAQPPQPHYYGNYGAYYPYPPSQPAQAHQNQQDDAHDQKKIKQEPQHTIKDKQHENHGIIKDGMELKMSPYGMFHRTAPSERSVPPANAPLPPDDRRYYLYPGEQRRKEETKPSQQVKPPPPSPKHQSKSGQPVQDKPQDLKSDEKIKQEGVKPTMETQGPPPPPTSQYAYIHPGYMPPQHYGALSFDPSHPMYRGISPMLVPGPYTGGPYLHQIPRYHGPEDLSRPPGKALELLQHHASQYYTAHKIHELQERALKSPTPKSSATSASPSAPSANPSRPPSGPPSSAPGPGPPQLPPGQTQSGKQPPSGSQSQPPQSQQAPPGGNASEKESRSPPPQRHVHTHHHTHVGLGYPLLPGQYPASYGAAVLASQQAAAVAASVISPFPPK